MSMKRSDDLRPVGLTSILDLLGSLLVIVAIALAVAVYTLPGALAAAGVLVLLLSWLIDRRTRA